MRVFQLLFQGVTENYPINRNTNNNARIYSFTVNHNLDKKKKLHLNGTFSTVNSSILSAILSITLSNKYANCTPQNLNTKITKFNSTY